MIKADIVKQIAKQLNLKDKDALAVVDRILESVRDVIVANGRLEIRDFGVFQVKIRKPRIGRNPKDKKEYPIPPRAVITFKPGKELKAHSVVKGAALPSASA
jgi:nucleoid DNA-binding protein